MPPFETGRLGGIMPVTGKRTHAALFLRLAADEWFLAVGIGSAAAFLFSR